MGREWQPSASRTDLVAELHHRHAASIHEAERRRRSRRTRKIILTIVAVLSLAGLGVAGKFGWDHLRHQRALASGRTHLTAATPADLEEAATFIDEGLKVKPGNDDALALLAVVRAHQAVHLADTTDLQAALGDVADEDDPGVVLSRAIASAVEGDLAAVETALEQMPTPPDEPTLARLHAWLLGTTALGKPYDAERVDAAIAALEAVVTEDAWAPAHRWLVALLLRAGRLDDALARLQAAREAAPADLGIAADEAVVHAVVAQHEDGVLEVTERLLAQPTLVARDRARCRLAQAIVGLRRTEGKDRKESLTALDEAWAELPAWDLDAQDLAIEAGLAAGEAERVGKWVKKIEVDDETKDIYDAWLLLANAKIKDCLEAAAKLSQTHPRVAFVQALALVEQSRWAEAGPWVERASKAFPERLELRVAAARVQAQIDKANAETAEKTLSDLSDDYPHAPRVFTGLAQARLAIAGKEEPPASVSKALRRALEVESRPAEAAFLLGTMLQEQAKKNPKKVDEATELLGKAAELDPDVTRYRASLGTWLAKHGDVARAEEVLRTIVKDTAPPADALLVLSRVTVERALERGKKVPKDDVEAWLTKAGETGADINLLNVERVRLALAAGGPETLPQTAASLAGLLTQEPANVELRVMHAKALQRQGNIDGARATVRDGLDKTPQKYDGRIYFMWAALEAADGNDRLGASLAYKGWQKVVEEPRPANELVRLADDACELWIDIDNPSVPRSIAKSLVTAAPGRADAWALQARMQLLDDDNAAGCASAKKAKEIDAELAATHAAIAECHISKHEYAEARKELAVAIERAEIEAERVRYKRRLRVIQ